MSAPINFPIAVPENTPFGPSTWPASGTDSYAEFPSKPLQVCHASKDDGGAYNWTRPVGCYIAVPGAKFGANWSKDTTSFMEVPVTICNQYNLDNKATLGINTFPAYRADTGAAYIYNGYEGALKTTGTYASPQATYGYSTPFCQAAYNVSAWGPRQK